MTTPSTHPQPAAPPHQKVRNGSGTPSESSGSRRKLVKGLSTATTVIAENTTWGAVQKTKAVEPHVVEEQAPVGEGSTKLSNKENRGVKSLDKETGNSHYAGKETSAATHAQDPSNVPPSKPLNVFSALFGECLCADNFRLPERGRTPAAQFIKLDGVECIALGAVMDEQTPRQRVTETVRQLSTRTERLISIGYLLDGSEVAKNVADEGADEGTAEATSPPETSTKGSFSKVTESIPLEVWTKNYPDDKSMKRNVRNTIDHIKKNQFDTALHEFETIMQEQKASPRRNDNHYLMGMTVHNMAVINLLAGKDDKALPLFREAAEIKRTTFGSEHPEVAVSLDEIGIQLFAQEQFEDALAVFNEARRIRVQALGNNHPKVAMVLNNIACCNFQTGNPLAALVEFQEARDIQTLAMGSSAKADLDLLHVATTLCNLGYMKLRLKQYDDAQTVFEEALLIQQSVLGDNHKTIKDTLSNMDFSNAFHS